VTHFFRDGTAIASLKSLEVRLLVVRQHPQRRAHLHRAYRGAGADELGELDERTLGLPDLAFVSLEHDVVAARDDADIELVFQRPEMVVVAPEEGEQLDVGGEGDSSRDRGGFAQLLGSLPKCITRAVDRA